MSDSSKQQPVPNKVVEVLVDSILRKNGVKSDELKKEIPDEQKKMIKEMVEDLKLQVEEFNKNNKKETKK
ncbi:hypothetical protein JYK21_02010 [Ralstonia pickettii]|nr:hypothetical protein [Ralstonia pickettii]